MVMAKNTAKALCLAAIASLGLLGCKQNSVSNSVERSSAAIDLTLCTGKTSSGFFTIQSLHEGYSNICYTDYAARQQLVLCDVPNCMHDSDSCKSYIQLEDGDFPPLILSTPEKILLVYSAPSSHDMAHIDMMDLNGNHKETLLRLENGESILGGVYTDGDSIYYEKWFVESAENGPIDRSAVYKTAIKTKESSLVYSLPIGYTVCGTSGANYVLSHYGDGNTESFYLLSPPGNSDEWALADLPFYECDLGESGAMILSGKIVEYFPKSYLLKVSDMASGKAIEMDCSEEVPPYDPDWIPDISPIYTGCTNTHYLKLTDSVEAGSGGRTIYQKVIDTSDRAFSENIILKDRSGREMLPVSEYLDYFCVITGYENLENASTQTNGDFLISSFDVPQYALILKSDYFAQIENLIPIENSF